MAGQNKGPSKQKRKQNRRTKIILLVFFILIAGAITYAVVQGKQGVSLNPKQLPVAQENQYATIGNGLIYIDDQTQTIYYNDLDQGKGNWYYELFMTGTKVVASDTMAVIYTDNSVQVVSPRGQALGRPIEFTNQVLSAVCGNQYFAVLTQDAQGLHAITIVQSETGEQQDAILMNDDFVVSYNFYGDDDKFWIMSVNTESPMPMMTVSTYSAGAKLITSVVHLQEELVTEVLIQGNNLYALGTNNLYTFEVGSGQEKDRQLVYGWELLDTSLTQNNVLFLLSQTTTDATKTAEVKLLSSDTTQKEVLFRVPAGCLNVFLYTDKVVAVTTNRVYIFNLKGELQRDYSLEGEFVSVQKLAGERILLNDGTNIYVAPIR